MFECVSPCVDEIKHHGNPSQTRPCRLSHESGIDLLFWVCVKKKIFTVIVMLLHQEISGLKLGPSNFSIRYTLQPFLILYFCLNTLISCQWYHRTTNLYIIPIYSIIIFLNGILLKSYLDYNEVHKATMSIKLISLLSQLVVTKNVL